MFFMVLKVNLVFHLVYITWIFIRVSNIVGCKRVYQGILVFNQLFNIVFISGEDMKSAITLDDS